MSDESIKPPFTSNKMLNRLVNYVGTKARVKFNGDCLKQENISYDHGKVVNIYIVYGIDRNVDISSYTTLENCLFGAVKLTRHVDMISINIMDMELDWTVKDFFQLVMKLVEM